MLCAVSLGCRSWTRYDACPTVPTYTVPPAPLGTALGGPVAPTGRVTITPAELVAPVCSEVVLVASVCDEGYLMANQQVSWALTPESVGHFLNVGNTGSFGWLISPFSLPRQISARQAVTATTAEDYSVPAGPGCASGVCVRRGQAWLSVTSPQEGVSYVSACCPDLPGGSARQQTAAIYWIDGQWTFPPPSIQPLGASQTLATTVARATNGSPIAGWIVRYEVVSGPDAGFGPQRERAIEVSTNELGQAMVDLTELDPTPGTNEIRIEVLYPQAGKRLVVGRGSVQHTWTSSLALTIQGPPRVDLGRTAEYVLEVNNPANQGATNVAVAMPIPPGFRFVSSDPPAEQVGNQLQWQYAQLAAGDRRSLAVRFALERPGTHQVCATLVASGDVQFQQCVTTTVPGITGPGTPGPGPNTPPATNPPGGPNTTPSNTTPPNTTLPTAPRVNVAIEAPATVELGKTVDFNLVFTNLGNTPATGLLITDAFDAGLKHAVAESPIERDLDTLAPGQTRSVKVTFTATQAGRQCNRVVLTGAGNLRQEATRCVEVTRATPMRPQISLRKTGPATKEVGQDAEFAVEVRNTGDAPLTGLVITDRYGPELRPVFATENYKLQIQNGYTLTWNVDRLPVGEAIQLRIVCRCESASSRACGRAEVATREGVQSAEESCLAVRAPTSMLTVSVINLHNPVDVGQDVPFEIHITNSGATSATHISVEAFVPPEMTPKRVGTSGPSRNFDIDGRAIRYSPFPELQPGQSITYRVMARADRPGEVKLSVRVSGDQLTQPLENSTTTKINPPQ